MPYLPKLSGDSLFWVIVQQKKSIIPCLIRKLSDTTQTKINVPNFGGNYTLGDIANSALMEIMKFPSLDLVDHKTEGSGYLDYWTFVRSSYKNRILYQKRVKDWYIQHEEKLVWKIDSMAYRTSHDWKFKSKQHPAGGYYKLNKE